jgi:hypothetical protein
LEQASREWIGEHGIQIDRVNQRLTVSKIFEWYAADFTPTSSQTIPGVASKYHGVLDFIGSRVGGTEAEWIRGGEYSLVFMSYDWRLNGT